MADYQKYWNKRAETFSETEFRFVQQKAFLNELKYVWQNSIFYQEKFANAGLSLQDIKDLDDLNRIPFTEKTELRDSQTNHPPLGNHAIVPMEKVSRVYSTSGTTGRPTYIGLTRHDIEVWRETASRALWTGGFRPNSIVPLIVAPYLIADSYTDAIEHIGATSLPTGVGATDRLIGAFRNIGANGLLAADIPCRTLIPPEPFPDFRDWVNKGNLTPKAIADTITDQKIHFPKGWIPYFFQIPNALIRRGVITQIGSVPYAILATIA